MSSVANDTSIQRERHPRFWAFLGEHLKSKSQGLVDGKGREDQNVSLLAPAQLSVFG